MLFIPLAGAAIGIGAELAARLRERRDNPLADLLSRDLRVRPSGADGRYTRGDHLLNALRCLGALGICVWISTLSDAAAGAHPRQRQLWMMVILISTLLTLIAGVAVLVLVVRAVIGWKGPLPPGAPVPNRPPLQGATSAPWDGAGNPRTKSPFT